MKILDATMRDGGLVNNFEFSDEFARDLYMTNYNSGVSYMEFGYRASTEFFDEKQFGKWKFCKEEDIAKIIQDLPKLKISVMIDIGRCDWENDFCEKSKSVVDLVRIATYPYQISEAIHIANYLCGLGYETAINLMAVSTISLSELEDIAITIGHTSYVDYFYIVDSYGALRPNEIQERISVAALSNKMIGIHTHNNQQLAYANTLAAMDKNIAIMDATYFGMGRGAGNCPMELITAKTPHVWKFIEKHMMDLSKNYHWGYHPAYAITGKDNKHPKTAIAFIKEKRTDLESFFKSTVGYWLSNVVRWIN